MTFSGQEKLKYIAEHYMKLMLSRAYSVLSDAAEAEDACQEAFIRIMKNIDRIEDVTEMKTAALCAAVAKNAAIDLYRKKSRSMPVEEVFKAADSTDTDPQGYGAAGEGKRKGAPGRDEPYEKTEQKEAVGRILRLIDGLPEGYREVLRLRCLNGLDAAASASLLGITENTVNIRLSRARKLLRERLEEA